MWKRFLSTLGAVTALASVLSAAQLHVPGDFIELQDAIDNAQPGDMILVHGGIFNPITIDKPLTILGEPRPVIRYDADVLWGGVGYTQPHVTLAGDGSGVLVLRNLQIGPGWLDWNHAYQAAPAIEGGGFEQLHLVDSQVEAAKLLWFQQSSCCFHGQAALSTDIPQILVSNSSLRASPSHSETCELLPSAAPQPGILAPLSTVVVLRSVVEGGGQHRLCSTQGCLDPDYVKQVLLQPAVRSHTLFEADSTFLGGSIHAYVACSDELQADPLDVVQHVPFPLRMRAFTDLRLGQTWTVYWTASPDSTFSTLFLSTQALLPPLQTTSGWQFFDFAGLLPPRTVYGTATRRFDFHVPVHSSLIGVEVLAQAFDPVAGFTHPIADCVAPQVVPAQVAPTQSP